MQALLKDAYELKQRGNLDTAGYIMDKAMELAAYVHGTGSQIVREGLSFNMQINYENKKAFFFIVVTYYLIIGCFKTTLEKARSHQYEDEDENQTHNKIYTYSF